MRHRIRQWNQVGFQAKADFAPGPAVAFDPTETWSLINV